MRIDVNLALGHDDKPRRRAAASTPLRTNSGPIRIGFVPLLDCAPLIVAQRNGYFADEQLTVELERQIGWGNVRDKLTFGRLDAAHALLGMPLLSALGRDSFTEPLVAVMNLGCGTDAITFGKRLTVAGILDAASLADASRRLRYSEDPDRSREPSGSSEYLRHRLAGTGEVPLIAHVFGCSVHHYLLRNWLHEAGVDPDNDVRLCVLPPPQVAGHLARGELDGFCVGEPWNSLAMAEGSGRIVAVTSDVVPSHPDKVLAVRREWSQQNPDALHRLIRAVLRGVQFCAVEENVPRIAEVLSNENYLNLPAGLIEQSLLLPQRFAPVMATDGDELPTPTAEPAAWCRQAFEAQRTFPSVTHHAWLAGEMARWGHLPRLIHPTTFADCIASDAYRAAAASVGIPLPSRNDPPMPLRDGWFEFSPAPRSKHKAALVSH